MSVWTVILIALVVIMFVGSFVICCPDLLPWNRRKKK